MATAKEYTASILSALVLVQNSEMTEDEMERVGVTDILEMMDDVAGELVEVLG